MTLPRPTTIVAVLHLHADAHVGPIVVNQIVIRVGIGGKPIFAVDLLSVAFDYRKFVVLGFGDGLAF